MLEGYAEFIPLLTQLFDMIDGGILRGFTSELTLAETLQETYKNTIQTSAGLQVARIPKRSSMRKRKSAFEVFMKLSQKC